MNLLPYLIKCQQHVHKRNCGHDIVVEIVDAGSIFLKVDSHSTDYVCACLPIHRYTWKHGTCSGILALEHFTTMDQNKDI